MAGRSFNVEGSQVVEDAGVLEAVAEKALAKVLAKRQKRLAKLVRRAPQLQQLRQQQQQAEQVRKKELATLVRTLGEDNALDSPRYALRPNKVRSAPVRSIETHRRASAGLRWRRYHLRATAGCCSLPRRHPDRSQPPRSLNPWARAAPRHGAGRRTG